MTRELTIDIILKKCKNKLSHITRQGKEDNLINIDKLKGKITENGHNIKSFAELNSMDRSTFYRKLENPKSITIGEVLDFSAKLNLTGREFIDIFLPHISHMARHTDFDKKIDPILFKEKKAKDTTD